MNDFLQRYARQCHESGAAKTFLAIDSADHKTILGFLQPGAGRFGLRRYAGAGSPRPRPARCPRVPAARRCLRAAAEVGGIVLIIDAKDDRAARWYANYGAVSLRNNPLALVMSLATFAAGLKAGGQL
jgi:hypothetical protein